MKVPKQLIQSFITSEFSYKKTSTGEYIIHSPFNIDKKGKLYINEETGQWIDFKGGDEDKGSFLSFVKKYLDLPSNSEALKYLITNYSVGDTSFKEEVKELTKPVEAIETFLKNDKPVFFTNPSELGIFGRRAYRYVISRDIDPYYIPKLGYVFNDKSRYNERIIIPFFENGKMVYFISRAVDPKNPIRYLNIDKLDSKEFVFNIDSVQEGGEVIICEGTFDCMSITRDQSAVCMLSADIGVKQMEKIFAKHPKTIIYVPDKDETGRKKLSSNINKLITYCPYDLEILVYNIPGDYKDFSELKQATGKNYILKKECEKWQPKKELFSNSLFRR